jgi:AraC-like DNA-binding protein
VKKQIFFPRASEIKQHNTILLRTLGLDHPAEGLCDRAGKAWQKQQVIRQEGYFLSILEGYRNYESVSYTRQENYIKFTFWLGTKHTTVLDGYGQHEHDRPEIFLTSGPQDMVKVDLWSRDTPMASVALCLLPEFFPAYMGLDAEQLPEPLHGLMTLKASPYAFHRFAFTPDLLGAVRSILAAPFAVRCEPIYTQAKSIELMCLLINQMYYITRKSGNPMEGLSERRKSRLHEARDMLMRHYGENLTLERIAREVGLNRLALTNGFRQLFGMSVHDCLQKIRMERAYELLQGDSQSIGEIAELVGYRHACNFSTAFHAYFGSSPQGFRVKSRE